MKRSRLIAARGHKNWTLEVAAEHLEVAVGTLSRWEHGTAMPYAFNIEKLCAVYGMSATDLGLEQPASEQEANPAFSASMEPQLPALQEDLTLRLFALVIRSRRTTSRELQRLQAKVVLTVEECDSMNTNNQNYQITRREALQRLALLPLMTLGISPSSVVTHHPFEDILAQCAAGVTACRYLAKGQHGELALAWSTLSAYLPSLKAIAKDSAQHRKEATNLVAQCYLLKHVLGLHIESPNVAIAKGYAKRALTYSKECDDLFLQLTALKYLTWAYNSDKQYQSALQTIEQAMSLIEQSRNVLPPRVCSGIYSTLAVIQAKNGVSAVSSLRLAQESFFASSVDDPALTLDVDLGYAQLMRNDGLAYYYTGQYQEALHAFAQVIDPNDLSPKVPMAVRTRVEILTNQTMAALKSPTRDREQTIKCWTASMQGAITLQSQQRFDEACLAYEVMAGVWPGDKRITEMRELTRHW